MTRAKMAAMDAQTAAPAVAPRWGRTALILVPAVAVIGLLTWATLTKSSAPQPGDAAPAFTAPLLGGGGTLSLSDLEGKPVVLNFWASWCLPCEDEAPILNRAERLYGDDISFVGINIKDAQDEALAFERRFEVPYPSVRDVDGSIYSDYALSGQPETFLIAADGTLVAHIPGQIPDQGGFFSSLDALLARR